MEREEMKEIILQVVEEEVMPIFLKMLSASEGRIDKTNAMIEKFSDCTAKMMSLMSELTENQNKQFCELERSRSVAQDNNTELIKANIGLSHMIEHIRNDHREQLDSYRAELHSAKEKFDEIFRSYTKLAELNVTNNNNNGNEIKITH